MTSMWHFRRWHGNVIDHAQARIDYLVKTLESLKSTIVIPTPVLSELLVGVGPQETQSILDEIREFSAWSHLKPGQP
jgi:hypothetical protein